jgi:hypothetical protein
VPPSCHCGLDPQSTLHPNPNYDISVKPIAYRHLLLNGNKAPAHPAYFTDEKKLLEIYTAIIGEKVKPGTEVEINTLTDVRFNGTRRSHQMCYTT